MHIHFYATTSYRLLETKCKHVTKKIGYLTFALSGTALAIITAAAAGGTTVSLVFWGVPAGAVWVIA